MSQHASAQRIKRLSLDEGDIIALDPGNEESGWVSFWRNEEASSGLEVKGFGKTPNCQLRQRMKLVGYADTRLVIEMPRAQGMAVANEVFLTCVEIGRFIQDWEGPWSFAFRGDVKLHVCGNRNAKDSNVSRALKDMFGGDNVAIGGVKCPKCKGKGWFGAGRPTCSQCQGGEWLHPPGPLHGMTADAWAALAIAVWWVQAGKEQHTIPPPKWKRDAGQAAGKE